MSLNKIILDKLDSMGSYRSRTTSVHGLMAGIKGYSLLEYEGAIIDLFKMGLIHISKTSGGVEISLDPKKKEEIYKILRK